MEILIIFIVAELLSLISVIFIMDLSPLNMTMFLIIFCVFISPMITLHMNDILTRIYINTKKYKRAIKLLNIKLSILTSRKANGILFNLIPLYFKINDIDGARNYLEQMDFLTIKNKVLKGYYYILMAYLNFKLENYKLVEEHIISACNYDEIKTLKDIDLMRCGVLVKEGKTEEAKVIFDKMPINISDYIEPIDDLYIELKDFFNNNYKK